MLLIHLVAAALAAAEPQSPEAKTFAISFQKAVACTTDMANQSSFDRDQLDRIPREALERCAAEKESAIQDMNKAIANSDPSFARDNVAAKMRMAAQERVIYRLEAGETLKASDESGFGLEKAGARYISCARLAINHKLEGIYVGQDWTSEIRGISEDQIEGYFVNIGRSSCPTSLQSYTNTLNKALNAGDGGTKKTISDNWDTPKIESLSVGPYVRMASAIRRKKP